MTGFARCNSCSDNMILMCKCLLRVFNDWYTATGVSTQAGKSLVWTSQPAGAAPNQSGIKLLEITRLLVLSFIIGGVIRQVMERKAAPGPSFLINAVIIMQTLTPWWHRCWKTKPLGGRPAQPGEIRHWCENSPKVRKRSIPLGWMNWVMKLGLREIFGSQLPSKLSQEIALLRGVQFSLSLSLFYLHTVSPSNFIFACLPPPVCVSHTPSPFYQTGSEAWGASVCREDSGTGAQGREMQRTENRGTTGLRLSH